jgi:hypothetical protein
VRVRFLADADLNKAIVSGVLHMPAHFRDFKKAGKHSAGLFLVPQSLDIGVAIEELLLIWLASESSDWEDRLEWLPLKL